MKRTAAVAGHFYHNSALLLSKQVEEYMAHDTAKEDVIGIVVPHAGLVYSGNVAGAVYSSINSPETFLLLGPNHTGIGPKISMMEEGEWEIPTGMFEIDRKLANRIYRNTETVTKDTQAHIFEHSLEVQLPFIAFLGKNVKILPITIMSASLEECADLGEGISKAIRDIGYPVVVAASSDMSHYVPDKIARQKDMKAIKKVLDIDPEGLYGIVLKENISMCGYLPVVVMLFAIKALGAVKARLVKYMTSGDISGDYDSVVGYAGVILK